MARRIGLGLLISSAVSFFGILAAGNPIPSSSAPVIESSTFEQPDDSTASSPSETSGVTLANFQRIKTDMTYDEVVAILGSYGEEMSRSSFADVETVMIAWSGGGISNMNAMFQNGRLISKAQLGLR